MSSPSNGPAGRNPQSSSQESDRRWPSSRSREAEGSSSPGGSGRHGKQSRGQADGNAEEPRDSQDGQTPLPKGQLAMLAVIALAEQTALNSISPYLPAMAASFPEVDQTEIGLYVGLIASAFALAQFATNFLWGWLSDRVGRKPIILTGTLATAACFVAFGFCKTLWQAILVQALMGLVNGNQGVVSTCLGEITDRSNQSRAFTYLPVIYGLGGITGPLVGGLMVLKNDPFHKEHLSKYPYLLPNLFSAAVLVVDFVLTLIFLKESLESAQDLPPLGRRIESVFSWFWQFMSAHRPTYLRRAKDGGPRNRSQSTNGVSSPNETDVDDSDDDEDDDERDGALVPLLGHHSGEMRRSDVFNRDTILLLSSYTIFQLGNIGYNSLYPIFSEAVPPQGRNLGPDEVGTSQAFTGLITIVFQVGIFGWLRQKVGNKTTYRVSLAGIVIAFLLMPWVGYKDGGDGTGSETTAGRVWLWVELGVILVIKTIASVGGLTAALLLITNSAPSPDVLGSLNGLAQTLSAGGRAVGPFISGALFSASAGLRPKGEALPFGIFGGISFVGLLLSFGIRSTKLEAEGEEGTDDDEEAES